MENKNKESIEAWPAGEMQRFYISAVGKIESRMEPIPEYAENTALVKIEYLGLCGTDAEFYTGESAFLANDLINFPVRFGHEWSGTVVAASYDFGPKVGAKVTGHPFRTCGICQNCQEGEIHLCLNHEEIGILGSEPGAAAEYLRVPVNTLVEVPENMSLKNATLFEPTVTAIQAIRRTRVNWNDRVAIIGTGTQGLLALCVANQVGAIVDVVGVEKNQLDLAHQLGAEGVFKPNEAETSKYDVVVEASGRPENLQLALSLLKPGGRVALVGMSDTPAQINVNEFVIKDAEYHGILHGIHNYHRALELFERNVVSAEDLVEAIYSFPELPEAMEDLVNKSRTKPKLLIRMQTD